MDLIVISRSIPGMIKNTAKLVGSGHMHLLHLPKNDCFIHAMCVQNLKGGAAILFGETKEPRCCDGGAEIDI